MLVSKVQSLTGENASLEAEAKKQEKIAAENARLRSIADKVYALEVENEKLEVLSIFTILFLNICFGMD